MTTNTDGAMPELLPCPFCSRPVPDDLSDTLYPSGIYWREDPDIGRHYISHSDEMARAEDDNKCWEMNCTQNMGGCGASIHADSREEAIAAWNRRAAIQQAAVPKTEDLRELLAKAPRLHTMLTMGGCPSCGSKDCIALSCQLEPSKQQPDSQYSGYWPDTPPRPVQQPALGGGEVGGVQTWLPIETAPTDGTRFLAFQAGPENQRYECWWQNDFSNWSGWQTDYDDEPAPTHWMPLPPPPAPRPESPTGQINKPAGEGMEGGDHGR